MPVVQPPKPRYRIEDAEKGLKITVPGRKHWVGIAIAGAFLLAMWAFQLYMFSAFLFGSSAPDSTSSGDGVALLLVLGPLVMLMAAFTLYATHTFLWNLIGSESILVGPALLGIRRQVLMFGRWREYLAEHIEDLRVQPREAVHVNWMMDLFWIASNGLIAFDYGARTIRFASSADEAEAKQILAAILKRFPQYRATDYASRLTEPAP